MDVQQYNLKIIHPYRTIFAFPLILLFSLFVSVEISKLTDDWVINLILIFFSISAFVYGIYRLCYGRILMEVSDQELNYHWRSRLLFARRGQMIPINQISKLRIDNEGNQLAIKIYSDGRSLFLNSSRAIKALNSDMPEFIERMEQIADDKRIKVLTHWEEWKEMGYVEIAYKVNTFLLYGAMIALPFFIWHFGFTNHRLLYFIGSISPLVGYQYMIKSKR